MSMNLADLYGGMSSTTTTVATTSVGGPNQGAVAPASERAPMNTGGGSPTSGAAFSWMGLVLLLIIWRVLIQMGGKA
jgi:hypothetical protein